MSTEPKERPILFSAMMVEAILEGRKTQTRRVIKAQVDGVAKDGTPFAYAPITIARDGKEEVLEGPEEGKAFVDILKCPYGKVGDRLWVRETWYDNLIRDEGDTRLYDEHGSALVVYRADGEFYDQFEEVEGDPKWRPSIFMPRWASRILLEVVSVRVERLQSITPADAVAEGCPHPPDATWTEYDAVCWYGHLWDVINGRGAWCSNPWVWVIEFKVLEVRDGR